MDDQIVDALKEYATGYIERFNDWVPLVKRMRMPAPHFAEPIRRTLLFLAKDGATLFYLTTVREGPIDARGMFAGLTESSPREGIIVIPRIEYTLTQILQSLTTNRVKIFLKPTQRMTNEVFASSFDSLLPPDIPSSNMVHTTISEEILDYVRKGTLLNTTGMAVGPVHHYEDGYAKETQPTRQHIWSPVLSFPNDQTTLQYVWPFIDVFWMPERLNLNRGTGRKLADADVQALRMGISMGFPQPAFPQNSAETASKFLFDACQKFENLLNNPTTKEPNVQAFLEQPGHEFILSPSHQQVFPRKRLGSKFITDFVFLRMDDDYHLVEIENPNIPIYQPEGQEQAEHLTHALGQVKDWLRYIEDNRDTVGREDGLPGIYKPTAEVIAGRDSHLGPEARRRFDYDRKESAIAIRTYDMVLREARGYAESLKRVLTSLS